MARIIKCLSIQEPWLTLILRKAKTVENRGRKTRYRGELGLHCSKGFDLEGYHWLAMNMPGLLHELGPLGGWVKPRRIIRGEPYFPMRPSLRKYWAGHLVGVCNLSDCVTEHPSPYFRGPFGWLFEDVIRLVKPIKAQGRQGFFDVLVRERDLPAPMGGQA